ncbi:MAG: VWA domain-containing protein [Dehalococcoidia bacterium]|jgi:Ca-activated chloride channel family protein|nr:VWA domain-containing protein [Dehalococcoidia bacterium]
MNFAAPVLLYLLPLAALPAAWGLLRTRGRPAMALAELGVARAAAGSSWRTRLQWAPGLLRTLAIVAIVVALARPREGLAITVLPEEGIDVVVALDASSSMEAEAQSGTTRLAAARAVVEDFVATLEGDRVGLVVFQSRALALSPLTLDHKALTRAVRNVRSGLLPDGTAIGLGMSEALNLLRDSPARSRVVVLLTDGQNNAGEVFPVDAAQIASTLNIRIYTIGFTGGADPRFNATGGVDEATLKNIATITDAEYYNTSTQQELAAAYEAISDQERSRVGEREFTSFAEFAPWLVLAALSLLVVEAVLRATALRRYP